MMGSWLWIVATVPTQAAWLSLMARDDRGRGWHIVLSSIPSAAAILHATLPDGMLGDAITDWMAAGGGVLAVLAVAWLTGTPPATTG